MAPRVGFVLLTHAHVDRAFRLVGRLTAMFGAPPIAWHHDAHQTPLDAARAPANVRFVRPPLRTRWAEFSVVEATVRALRLLVAGADAPDWCVVLSGACYPIRPAARVVDDLCTSPFDAHIEHAAAVPGGRPDGYGDLCHARYCTARVLRVPWVTARLRPATRRVRVAGPAPLVRRLLPYGPGFGCYAGSQWFAASRRAAEHVVAFHADRPALARHLRHLAFPEETYFQTILANAPRLRLSPRFFRYVDWSADEAHPKTLTAADLPAMLASDAHFARKFDARVDAGVLDALDAATGEA